MQEIAEIKLDQHKHQVRRIKPFKIKSQVDRQLDINKNPKFRDKSSFNHGHT